LRARIAANDENGDIKVVGEGIVLDELVGDGEENESLATFATLSRRSLRGVDIDCSDNASEELLVIKFSFSLSRDENMGPKPLGRRKLFVRTRPLLSTKTPEGNVVRILCIATESIIQVKEEETFSKSVWRL
jgi:hypothetical protein